MNKTEELLDKICGLIFLNPDKYGNKYNQGVRNSNEIVEQYFKMHLIPEVPQFVADWYEERKDDFETELFWCISLLPDDCSSADLSVFDNWLVDEQTKPFQTLVNMHQFGYTVKK